MEKLQATLSKATAFGFLPSVLCIHFSLSSIPLGEVYDSVKIVPPFFGTFFFYAAAILFHLHLIAMICKAVFCFPAFKKEIMDNKAAHDFFLIPTFYGWFGEYFLKIDHAKHIKTIYGNIWFHFIIFAILLCSQVYFWYSTGKTHSQLSIIVVALGAVSIVATIKEYSAYRTVQDLLTPGDSITSAGWDDLALWYHAMLIPPIVIFLNFVMAALREEAYHRTPLVETLSFFIIATYIFLEGLVFPFQGLWLAGTVSIVLFIVLIHYIVKNGKNVNVAAVLLATVALSLTISFFPRGAYTVVPGGKAVVRRTIYRVVAAILYYFGIVCCIVVIVLYFGLWFAWNQASSKKSESNQMEALEVASPKQDADVKTAEA